LRKGKFGTVRSRIFQRFTIQKSPFVAIKGLQLHEVEHMDPIAK